MSSGHDQPWESFEEGYMYHLYHVSPETVAFQEGNINVNVYRLTEILRSNDDNAVKYTDNDH